MNGQYSGLQAQLKKNSASSIFTHCHAYVLNLIIGDATNYCTSSQNLFVIVKKLQYLFHIPIKGQIFGKLLQKKIGREQLRKLKKIGETR